LTLPATFEFASPVAASALGSPIKVFTAVFKLTKSDPHVMPDLSAAVVVDKDKSNAPKAGASERGRECGSDCCTG